MPANQHQSDQFLSRWVKERYGERLRLPVFAAPMFQVSGTDYVVESCRAGVIGAFPTVNCRSIEELEGWFERIDSSLDEKCAPYAVNLVVHPSNKRRDADLELICRYKPEIVITSVGNPEPVLAPIQEYGGLVFADVATHRHAQKALEIDVDGLILLTAGAGGQTGWANPFAFARGVRQFFDGPIVLAGGIADARAIRAAEVLGADFAYMGTRFLATKESLAQPRYKDMVREAKFDDIKLTDKVTGIPANMLVASLIASGLDPDNLPERGALNIENDINPNKSRPKQWKDVWSAGHSVELVEDVPTIAELVEALAKDYAASTPW
ncbi:nitronate monooxygenase [Seongchinamella unica]|uniref:Nitronate monooxygenase n=1 Tax=Seongchinamella unica TaxID=2547392 RepID=A0A4R5LMU5_9GAMM|nr:nitronate monooxygenase [Seongchinamella unica]TDG11392.1 nitronate monooxygenase [Seongchinamella unica]